MSTDNLRPPEWPARLLRAVLRKEYVEEIEGDMEEIFFAVAEERSEAAAKRAYYWETLRLLANGLEPRSGREGGEWNREQLRRIDLRWHDLRHEGACRLLADGVDIRIIQLMLGHASIQQTQRYLNVTDEELRRGLEVSWKNEGRPLRLASGA